MKHIHFNLKRLNAYDVSFLPSSPPEFWQLFYENLKLGKGEKHKLEIENRSQNSTLLYPLTTASCIHRAVQHDVAELRKKVGEM